MTFAFIDIIFAIIILVLAIRAAFIGLWEEVLGKLAIVIGLICAICFYKDFTGFIVKYINNSTVATIISFLCVFLAVYLIISLVKVFLSKIFNGSILGSLNHFLGFLFGCLEGFIAVALILILLNLQPFFDVSSILNNSFFYSIIGGFIIEPQRVITENIKIALNYSELTVKGSVYV